MLESLRAAEPIHVGIFFLISNVVIFIGSILLCWLLGVMFSGRRIFDRWEPIRPIELTVALLAVILNAGVSVVGWWLWTQGVIELKSSTLTRSVFDCSIMILAMDLGMYGFHRLAHQPPFFQWIHRLHHRHEATNPISLFVLHPLEVLGFGGLMILFLTIYPMTLAGLIGYLTLNVLFGTLGHSGVEPFPPFIRNLPVLRLIGTSTFHAEHHEHPRYNFGFYTLFWDKLFGTLDPDYDRRFRQIDGNGSEN
jgi:sterol desaturase/sphingolipid hydroxylase (fatty acid hydroxylase superfamily)